MRTMRPGRLRASCALARFLLLGVTAAVSQPNSWTTYRNEKFGFSLSVPTDTFIPGKPRQNNDGWLWISRDRQARLLAVAGSNETGETLESYRRFVMEQSYGSASFDETPVHETWFVLSGTKGAQAFYEHVIFVCGGRYIQGWQMMYPASDRALYGRVAEEIQKSFQPGRGPQGSCA